MISLCHSTVGFGSTDNLTSRRLADRSVLRRPSNGERPTVGQRAFTRASAVQADKLPTCAVDARQHVCRNRHGTRSGQAPSRAGHASVVSWLARRCSLALAALPTGLLTIVVGLGWATPAAALVDMCG